MADVAETAAPSPRARELLRRMLLSQAHRELAALRLYRNGLKLAPDDAARERLTRQAEEERQHFEAVCAAWLELTGEHGEVLRSQAAARLEESPLPRPRSWLELAMAQFVFDRAGYFQLREYEACSWAPYRRLVAPILAEEAEHQGAGAAEVIALASGAGAQAAFERWLRIALLSFGRPGSPASAEAIAFGLKRRDPLAVAQDFIDDLRPFVAQAGLRFPAHEALGLEGLAALRLA